MSGTDSCSPARKQARTADEQGGHEESRLCKVLGIDAPQVSANSGEGSVGLVAAAVQSHLATLSGCCAKMQWLCTAAAQLASDSRRTRVHKKSNQEATRAALAPPLLDLARSGDKDWAGAVVKTLVTSPSPSPPVDLFDFALARLANSTNLQSTQANWQAVWGAVAPVFVELAGQLRAMSVVTNSPAAVDILRTAANLGGSKVAFGAYVLHAESCNEWIPPPTPVPVWMGGRGNMMPRGKAIEEMGILGPVFSVGCIPDCARRMHGGQGLPGPDGQPLDPWDAEAVGEYFFPDPAGLLRRRAQDIASEVEMIGSSMRALQLEQFRLVKSLLRKDTSTREPTLNWLAAAAEINTNRAKEYALHTHDSSDNFLVNLAYVMLRLCAPLLDDEARAGTINPLFAVSAQRFIETAKIGESPPKCTFDNETKFAIADGEIDAWVDKRNLARIQAFAALRMKREAQAAAEAERETSTGAGNLDLDELALAIQMSLEQPQSSSEGAQDINTPTGGSGFNFGTECFFMTARVLHHGLIATMKSSVNRNVQHGASTYTQLLQALGRAHHDIRLAQRDHGDVPAAMMKAGKIHVVKNLIDSSCLEPELLQLVLRFYILLARWLTRMATGLSSHSQVSDLVGQLAAENRQLPLPPPLEFSCLPEHFAEDMCELLFILYEYAPNILNSADFEGLQSILSLLVLLLDNPAYVRNPYLRCKFVRVVYICLQPSDEDQEQRRQQGQDPAPDQLFAMLHRNPVVRKLLIPALLRLYVDLENTGSHNQFHEKFEPRAQCYDILQQLCDTSGNDNGFFACDGSELQRTTSGDIQGEGFPLALVHFMQSDAALKFLNLLINDATYVFEDSMLQLSKVKELEAEQDGWGELPDSDRQAKQQEYEQAQGLARYHLSQTDKTFQLVGYLTDSKDGSEPFLQPSMIGRLAAMLNAFLTQLVGPKMSSLKVSPESMKRIQFDPKSLLQRVLRVASNLYQSGGSTWVRSIVADGLYKAQIFVKACSLLRKLRHDGDSLVQNFSAFVDAHDAAIKDSGTHPMRISQT